MAANAIFQEELSQRRGAAEFLPEIQIVILQNPCCYRIFSGLLNGWWCCVSHLFISGRLRHNYYPWTSRVRIRRQRFILIEFFHFPLGNAKSFNREKSIYELWFIIHTWIMKWIQKTARKLAAQYSQGGITWQQQNREKRKLKVSHLQTEIWRITLKPKKMS